MNWSAAGSTFLLVFLAELGDKTQLTTLTMAAKHGSPWPIFAGSALALVLSSLVGALAGGAIGQVVPAGTIRLVAGLAFLLFGGLLLSGRL